MTQDLCLSTSVDEENTVASPWMYGEEEVRAPAPESLPAPETLFLKETNTSDFSLEDVPQKNTFIHYDIPRSPCNRPATPTSSAPGMLLSRLFRTVQTKAEVNPPWADADKGLTPCSLSDARLDFHFAKAEHDDSEESTIAGSVAGSPVDALEASPNCLTTQVSMEMHLLGHCTPCNYFLHKEDGCRQGSDCQFCHMCPKGEIKKRKKDKLKELRKSGALSRKSR